MRRDELVKQTLEQGTKLLQAVADALFNLPSTEDPDGPIVTLPPPTTKLPREKPVCIYLPSAVVEFILVFSVLPSCALA